MKLTLVWLNYHNLLSTAKEKLCGLGTAQIPPISLNQECKIWLNNHKIIERFYHRENIEGVFNQLNNFNIFVFHACLYCKSFWQPTLSHHLTEIEEKPVNKFSGSMFLFCHFVYQGITFWHPSPTYYLTKIEKKLVNQSSSSVYLLCTGYIILTTHITHHLT